MIRPSFVFLFPFLGLQPLAAQDITAQLAIGKAQYETHCVACHQLDAQLVGPSLIEIAGLYRKNPKGFVQWAIAPEKKRADAIEMPSMAHVGEDNLLAIHAYVLDLTKGKKLAPTTKKRQGDPHPLAIERPLVQRIFIPDASPAAIAVALPESDLNYCFDAALCRLRYVWQGEEFLDGWPYWRSNGNSYASPKGKRVYTEEEAPFGPATKTERTAPPKFLGYTVDKEGLPTFRYRDLGTIYTETLTALPSGRGIMRKVTCDSDQPLQFLTSEGPGLSITLTEPYADPVPGKPQTFTLIQSW